MYIFLRLPFLNVTSFNATVFGNVINRGIVHVAETHALVVNGNYYQYADGTLEVDLTATNGSALNITNSTTLNGNLLYKITKKPFLKSAKFPVVTSLNLEIDGSFVGTANPLEGSIITRELKLEYHPKIIYVIYDFNVKDVDKWEWLAIGLVGGFVVLATIFVLAKCWRRRKYDTIY